MNLNENINYKTIINEILYVDRPYSRNAIFAPSKFNSYGGAAFPGIIDLLHEIDDLDNESKKKRYEKLKRHVSDLMIMIKEASRFLLSTEIIWVKFSSEIHTYKELRNMIIFFLHIC